MTQPTSQAANAKKVYSQVVWRIARAERGRDAKAFGEIWSSLNAGLYRIAKFRQDKLLRRIAAAWDRTGLAPLDNY